MAEETNEPEVKSKGGIVPWILVGLLSAVAGGAVPFLIPAQGGTKTESKSVPTSAGKKVDTIFVPFGERGEDQNVVVNLNEGRMTRYLRVAITLEVPKSLEITFPKLLESKKAQLRNWLLSEISDKDLDEIRGAAGQNRLRRAIHEHFNAVLFPDGYDRIQDVLFEEFNVQ